MNQGSTTINFYKEYSSYSSTFYELTGMESPIKVFKALWERSTSFAIVNSLVPVIDSYGGKKKLKSVQNSFKSFPPLHGVFKEACWASIWPGTSLLSEAALILFGQVESTNFDKMFSHCNSVYWRAPGGWDDLMLFYQDQLLFYVCSHEQFGVIMGEDSFLKKLGLSPINQGNNKTWEIKGRAIEPSMLSSFIGC
jgi:hypothetical protein